MIKLERRFIYVYYKHIDGFFWGRWFFIYTLLSSRSVNILYFTSNNFTVSSWTVILRPDTIYRYLFYKVTSTIIDSNLSDKTPVRLLRVNNRTVFPLLIFRPLTPFTPLSLIMAKVPFKFYQLNPFNVTGDFIKVYPLPSSSLQFISSNYIVWDICIWTRRRDSKNLSVF